MEFKRIEHTVEDTAEGRLYRLTGRDLVLWPVTTTLGVLDKPALDAFRASIGKEAADAKREDAREVGTEVHKQIRRLCSGKPIGTYEWSQLGFPTAADNRVRNCLRAYKRFKNETGYRPLAAELFVFSEWMQFAGTLDNIGWIRHDGKKLLDHDELALVDFKTPDHLYWPTWLQLGAYAGGVEEQYGLLPQSIWRVRLDRETGLPEYDCKRGECAIRQALDRYVKAQALWVYAQENGGLYGGG